MKKAKYDKESLKEAKELHIELLETKALLLSVLLMLIRGK